jgi:hypothetical protein
VLVRFDHVARFVANANHNDASGLVAQAVSDVFRVMTAAIEREKRDSSKDPGAAWH